jgi:hypothetical protein
VVQKGVAADLVADVQQQDQDFAHFQLAFEVSLVFSIISINFAVVIDLTSLFAEFGESLALELGEASSQSSVFLGYRLAQSQLDIFDLGIQSTDL